VVRLPGHPVVPDVVTVAKALANGLPIGACIARGQAAKTFQPGDHATTFGGNPVTCAAALRCSTRSRAKASSRPRGGAPTAARRARRLAETSSLATGVRGRGLLLGVELAEPVAAEVEAACRDRLCSSTPSVRTWSGSRRR
jgi:acetylornithine/N-succinyldiaminopimelate aminotransferase